MLCLILAVACTREQVPGDGGWLTVDLGGLAKTKSIIGATAAEMQVNSVNLYVFDSNGMLDVAHACSSNEINAKQAVLNVKTGGKTIYALANFRVASGTGGSATLSLSRQVARVALGSVTNRLPAPYGTVRVLRAFLCNVVGNQNVAGTASASVWYNKNATSDNVAGHVIGTTGHAAQEASLTYADLNENVALNEQHAFSNKFFYALPNARTNPNNGFSATFSPTATVLMVVVQIKNVPYYYPVALTGTLERNKDYKVDLTLIGLGNTEDQPFNKIERANLSASVQVSDWTSGATYTESI